MSKLPSGWAFATLGEIASYVTSGSRDWSKYYSNHGAFFVRTENINTNRLANFDEVARVELPDSVEGKRTLILRDDLLITITGANVGKCAHVDRDIPEAYVSQSVALVRLLDSSFARFVHKQLIAPGPDGDRTLLQQSAYGLGRPVLNLDNVRALPLRIAPASEQLRIADKLDALITRVEACRSRLDRVTGTLKRFRQAVLAAATSGELTREWREGHSTLVDAHVLSLKIEAAHAAAGGHKPGNAAPPTDGVHDLTAERFPTGWSLLTLRDLVRPDRPITYGILKPGPEHDNGVPYVRVADFPNDRLNLATIRKTSPAMDEEFKRSRLKHGDLLLSIRGTVGRLVVVPPELECANITQDTARISIQPEVNASFVLWALRSELVQQRMKSAMKGVAVRGINIGDVRALQVPLPSRAEQDEIVRRVEALLSYCDEMAGHVERSRTRVECLTQSVLAKAFRGELVSQDPNDEPASELVAKLKAEQAGTSTKQLRKRTKTLEKRPTMINSNKDAIKATILKLKSDNFTFNELRDQINVDYEALKVSLFALLEEPNPIVRQVFDKKSKAMHIVRVKP